MKQLNKFINELKDIFGKRLKSVFIYGSKANLNREELDSDINLMVITDSLSGSDIRKCCAPSKKWMGKGFWEAFQKHNPEPVFMGEKEWYNSSDIYAMQYADIQDNNKILYGEDVICSIKVKREDLRFQCESEIKNLLMRFRAHYLVNALNKEKLEESVIPVIKSSIAIFKAILRIKDIEVPKSPYEVIQKVHDITAIDKELFERLLCSKEKYCKMNKDELDKTADKLVFELTKLLDFTNNL